MYKNLFIGLLVCGRSHFTIQTTNSLVTLNPEFKDAYWTVFDNNPEEKENREHLESLGFIDLIISSSKNIGIARATSILMNLALADQDKFPYTMYLQNDWKCIRNNFFPLCMNILDENHNAFIKLSTKNDWKSHPHAINKRPQNPILLKKISGLDFYILLNGHFTMNPFIIHTDLLYNIFPATCEKESQLNFYNHDLRRIDFLPEQAPFEHIGKTEKNRTPNWIR